MTIVVLLILAGITISLVFSENGIIAKAREAAEKTNQAVINEQEQMNDLAEYMGNIINSIGGVSTPEGPEMPDGWDETKVDAVESTDTIPIIVPVPKGYTASKVTGESTVEDGFVIYEGIEEVNDTNKDTAQTTRNQFVWVPVENPSEMYGTDSSGKKMGKLYNFSADRITPLNWTEQNGIMTITATSGDSSYHEPDILPDDSANSVTLSNLETEFNSMIEGVEKYGGFYIGRYETGNLSQMKAVIVKNNTDIGSQTWYNMYNKSKEIAINNNVISTMIWGCQWDAVLRWMYNSGDSEKKEYTYNTYNMQKGNYGTSSTIPTGTNQKYAVNNIYDMAGNVYEWTMEIFNINYRVYRGGYYGGRGDPNTASLRLNRNPPYDTKYDGCRIALYIN